MKLTSHVIRHRWFYIALALGASAAFIANAFDPSLAIPVGGDTFYGAYLILIARAAKQLTAPQLQKRAAGSDEGILLIGLITIAATGFSIFSIFMLVNSHPRPNSIHLTLALLAAPLAWFVLHIVAAFHYAHYYYGDADCPGGEPYRGGLRFPGQRNPSAFDFIYFAFVVGMTAQTADVDIQSTWIRRRATGHGIISFAFNAVLIAMAVNVVVALIQNH